VVVIELSRKKGAAAPQPSGSNLSDQAAKPILGASGAIATLRLTIYSMLYLVWRKWNAARSQFPVVASDPFCVAYGECAVECLFVASRGLEGVAMNMSRRGFIKLTGAGLAASSLGALGFGAAGDALAASVRPFKLTATTETRNTCTYCSVACGILIYSLGDRAKNAKSDIIHIEGDPDHPVNRGTHYRGRARRDLTAHKLLRGGIPNVKSHSSKGPIFACEEHGQLDARTQCLR
jgi:hypothetical protein